MPPTFDSRTLYAQCTSADLDVVHTGFQQLGVYLLRTARGQLSYSLFDDMVVEDCTQEALLDIWHNLKEGNGPQSDKAFLAWSRRIVINKAISRYRYEKSRRSDPVVGEPLADTPAVEHNALEYPGHQLLLDERTIELILSIRTRGLSSKSEVIVIDGILFDKTDIELARELGTTNSNVRLIRHRNLGKLRDNNDFMTNLLSRGVK